VTDHCLAYWTIECQNVYIVAPSFVVFLNYRHKFDILYTSCLYLKIFEKIQQKVELQKQRLLKLKNNFIFRQKASN